MLARSIDWIYVMRSSGLALATVLGSFAIGMAEQPENVAAGKHAKE